jgi:uncharacterized protein (DUF1800 family)
VAGLSNVFTGFSWACPAAPANNCFFNGSSNNVSDPDRSFKPMIGYAQFHSTEVKTFLGPTLAAQSSANPQASLTAALDALHRHPNIGPFIGRQLIQRMVTSNPSPAYVGRVTAAFNDNGAGTRGDMKAVWKAILLDPEARNVSSSSTAGKVREPVVRLANFMRAFNARSASGRFEGIGNTDDPATRLNQTPMFAPSVFNFYRPGYVPSSKPIADAGLVAPELQIVHDVSVAGYMNYLRGTIIPLNASRDIQQDYSAEIALAGTPADLVERMNLLLFYGQMPDALRTQLTTAVTSRTVPAPVYPASSASSPAPAATNQATIDAAKRDRVYLAVFLSMSSPDYLIQK